MKGMRTTVAVDYTRLAGTIISEPYPKVDAHRFSIPNNGSSLAASSSVTCVIVEFDGGGLAIDVPVSELEPEPAASTAIHYA